MITLDMAVAKSLTDIAAALDEFDCNVKSDEFRIAADIAITGIMHRVSNSTVARIRPEGEKNTILPV